jgi:inhibitor of KinA
MGMNQLRIYALNEQALTIEFGGEISPAVNNQVLSLHHALLQDPFEGFVESVPAYTTLTVYYDLWQINTKKALGTQSASRYVAGLITGKLSALKQKPTVDSPVLEVPVCYDLSMAPDLPWVAEYCRLSIPEIIALHSRGIYRVYMIGFIPGFPYLGMLPPALEVPRKLRPALTVPAGSVALAGRQTGIYPFNIPGGWQVIGRTTLSLFDVNREPCCSLEVGQLIKFEPISMEEYNHRSNL